MFGGLGGMDPKKMQAMMKQLGIKQDEVSAIRVVIEHADKRTVIEHPSVQKITMHGQESWQISGTAHEESLEMFSADDVALVTEKTGSSEADARNALIESNGDIAAAILALSSA